MKIYKNMLIKIYTTSKNMLIKIYTTSKNIFTQIYKNMLKYVNQNLHNNHTTYF